MSSQVSGSEDHAILSTPVQDSAVLHQQPEVLKLFLNIYLQVRRHWWLIARIAAAALSIWLWAGLFRSVGVAMVFFFLLSGHEAGHYLMARYKGKSIRLPWITPLGGIMSIQSFANVTEEAFIGLAGPTLGTLVAALALVAGILQHNHTVVTGAQIALFINLINLVPLPPLDGGRAGRAIWRHLWVLGATIVGLYLVWQVTVLGWGVLVNLPVLYLVLYFGWKEAGQYRQYTRAHPEYLKISWRARGFITLQYLFLTGVLVYLVNIKLG